MTTTPTTVGAALGLALLASQSATAATTTFETRGLWEAAAGGTPVVETFESEGLGSIALPSTLDSGLGIGLASGAVTSSVTLDDGFGFSNTTPDGRHSLRFGHGAETGSYSARFDLPVASGAFGFNISGWSPTLSAGGPTGGTNITLLNGGQIVDDFFLLRDVVESDVSFIGVTNTSQFDEVRVLITVFPNFNADDVAFDDVAWSVPTPGAASLLALGGLAAMRRRR